MAFTKFVETSDTVFIITICVSFFIWYTFFEYCCQEQHLFYYNLGQWNLLLSYENHSL